jgi:hypothetical protein
LRSRGERPNQVVEQVSATTATQLVDVNVEVYLPLHRDHPLKGMVLALFRRQLGVDGVAGDLLVLDGFVLIRHIVIINIAAQRFNLDNVGRTLQSDSSYCRTGESDLRQSWTCASILLRNEHQPRPEWHEPKDTVEGEDGADGIHQQARAAGARDRS